MQDEYLRLTERAKTDAEAEMVEVLLQQVDRFAAAHIDALEIDRMGEIPSDVIEGLADLGLFSASIPEEYGGAGFGMQAICSLVAGLAKIDRSVATTVGLHLGLGTRGIVIYGSDELKQHTLPKLASGEWVASFCATEPNAGSDLTAISTRAVADGDELVVNGTKAYVTNSGFAGLLTLLVASPGLGGKKFGHSMLFVHPDDPGVSFGEEEDKLGLHGSSTRTLHLDDVRIPASRIIGEPGEGMDQVRHVLAWGRTAMAAGCTGAADAAMDATITQVQDRHQFGKALIELPIVQDQVARMSAVLFAMRALVRYTTLVEDEADVLAARSTAAKVFCSEGDWEVTDLALQLHGGSGFIEETGLPLLLRDARITRIFEGANDVLRLHAGGMEATGSGDRTPITEQFPEMELARRTDALADRVASRRDALRDEYGMKLLRDHRLLHRLGSAVILREASDAAAWRALADGTPVALAHASHWVELAERRMDDCFRPEVEPGPVEAIINGRLGRTETPAPRPRSVAG